MRRRRRDTEGFSISFLDVITCGFGAVVLMVMISRPGAPLVPEETVESVEAAVARLQEELFDLRGQATVLNQELDARREQLSVWKERVARLSSPRSEKRKSSRQAAADAALKGKLQRAVQELTKEMERLLAQRQPPKKTAYVGGVPIDSEYIIFVVDTSGSMFQLAWGRLMEEMIGVLEIYPRVKGLQIMNDEGGYMFDSYRRRWILDSPGTRKIIIERLRTWNPFSNSSPVEGIEAAIRTFHEPDKKISIYVFGDDFTGSSIRRVLNEVERLNPKNSRGVPQIRIHAVGFPVQFANAQQQVTGMRFAALMRELTRRNMGTFVGLNDFRPTGARVR